MVTLNPAKQLRIDNRVGSIEVGKDADIAVWNHHPLSTMAIVERTYIDGIVYYDRIKDEQRAANVESEKALLLGRQGAPPASPPESPAAAPPPARQPVAPEQLRVQYNENGPAWAITNARIVPVSGPVIEKGTIVISGNHIKAVGAGDCANAGSATAISRMSLVLMQMRRSRRGPVLSGARVPHPSVPADRIDTAGAAAALRRIAPAPRASASP